VVCPDWAVHERGGRTVGAREGGVKCPADGCTRSATGVRTSGRGYGWGGGNALGPGGGPIHVSWRQKKLLGY